MRPQSETPAVGSSETARPEPRAKAATPADATNAETLPTALLEEIFKRELLDHGPALYVANLEGSIIWANAGGRLLPIEEIAAEITLLGSMVFREDVLRLGDAAQRLRSRHVALRDGSGEVSAIAGIVQSLPEESQRLETIAALRDRFDDLTRLVSDWTWETDASLVLVSMSNRVTEMLGFHPRELIGRNLLSLLGGETNRPAVEQRFQRHSPFR